MLNYKNPYNLEIVSEDGHTYYYVTFKDGQGIFHRIKISEALYLDFYELGKYEHKLTRRDERHIEYLELTDESLHARAKHHAKDLAAAFSETLQYEQIMQAIDELPSIQRRRFLLYHIEGLTYDAIGKAEGCSKASVKRSVELAKRKIREKLKELGIM